MLLTNILSSYGEINYGIRPYVHMYLLGQLKIKIKKTYKQINQKKIKQASKNKKANKQAIIKKQTQNKQVKLF